ncbi:MAG: UDP-N-acetylglucosamine 2-epimerase (non-hydrolyzing) [Mariniphaga sp.]|nr:UDP-N-acetylglucosamine 2-epimerase (non-hydrolyzing) [Mariniphaga sp.]
MNSIKIISVVGARPNFIKIAPFMRAINQYNENNLENRVIHILVHTGQHYDDRMSKAFFESLDIPEPDINLGIGSGSHAEQVGNTMIAYEKILLQEKPDWVVVVGDVNATLACSVTAKKLNINVCHIEAGLRSGDLTMPEEINRLVTDRISDLLLTPDRLSSENLRKEGVPEKKIKFVGNIMIDTLVNNLEKASKLAIREIIQNNLIDNSVQEILPSGKETDKGFALLTIHRPSNVDKRETLEPILDFLIDEVATEIPVIWPVHPRTQKMLHDFDLWQKIRNCPNIILLYPVGYHEMLRLNKEAKIMLTDSGGLQEECCVLGTPCVTLRWNTERPVTLKEHGGASVLVGNNVENIRKAFHNELKTGRIPQKPELWDGQTAMRCVDAIINYT